MRKARHVRERRTGLVTPREVMTCREWNATQAGACLHDCINVPSKQKCLPACGYDSSICARFLNRTG